MDSPGYDPVAVTGQIASGANLICFTTGRGSMFGSKPALRCCEVLLGAKFAIGELAISHIASSGWCAALAMFGIGFMTSVESGMLLRAAAPAAQRPHRRAP